MPGATANHALPYPLNHEPMADVADAITALAESLDAAITALAGDTTALAASLDKKYQAGTKATGAFTAVNTPLSAAVVFDTPFDAIPSVEVTVDNANPHQCQAGVQNVTTTGFNVRANRTVGTTSFTVHWTATARTQA